MRDLIILLVHLITILARLMGPGGARSVIAESLLVKQQLLIVNRSRQRAPNLRASDRILAGVCSLFMRPARVIRSAIVLKPSTILDFHRTLRAQKYRVLFSPKHRGREGSQGSLQGTGGGHCRDEATQPCALCCMFNHATRAHSAPKHLSSDHDPLYRFHQWRANLRLLRVTEVKSVPYVPMSHPFVERLIGTLRRECVDRMLFWSAPDSERKLSEFQDFYNVHRAHASLEGRTPVQTRKDVATLKRYRWEAHCRGLYQTPIAA